MDQLNLGERWAPIPGYEGHYEASDIGRIRSLDRTVPYRGGTPRRIRGRILKQGIDPDDGRRSVRLAWHGKSRIIRVHQLVLMAFRDSCPPGMEGCHNNGDAADNRLENLRWDTHSENMHDQARHGTNPKRNRTRCPRNHELKAPNLIPSTAAIGYRGCLACSRAQSNQKRALERGESFDFQAVADAHYARILDGTYVKRGDSCPRGHLLKAPNLSATLAAKGLRRCLACKRAGLRQFRARKRGVQIDVAQAADEYYAQIMAA